jgi:hypothetical protein
MRLSANAGGPIVLMGALQLMLAIRLILDDRFALWPTNHNGHSQASLAITLGAVALVIAASIFIWLGIKVRKSKKDNES